MRHFTCPNCKKESISLKDKYLAGVWRIIHCPACVARLTAQPVLMMLGSMLYVWVGAWFGFWAYLDHSFLPLLYMVPVWLLLDFLNVSYMPLSVLRPKGA